MALYADGTKVPVSRSRDEIERTLARYGADGFGYGKKDGMAVVWFQAQGRQVRFELQIPDNDREERRRWRVLLLWIKGKLEAVESEVTTFEEAFMANIVLANGQRVGQWLAPQLAGHYETQQMPKLLPGAF